MKYKSLIVLFFFVLLLLFALPLPSSATVTNVTIGTDVYYCGASDFFCPSDYAGCDPCTVDDPDCCTANACSWTCTSSGVVCGDSTNEIWKDETDSQGDTAAIGSPEDCSGTCTSGTEHVIDDSDEAACLDTYYNNTASCADDGILFAPYTATASVCEDDISCKDTDEDGDFEICDNGNWHDPDESTTYCTAAGGKWGTSVGADPSDDYDNNLENGYCQGDDGFLVTGAIVEETYRGSGACEAAINVAITIKDMTDQTLIYDTDRTAYSPSWSYETFDCQEGNEVGAYQLTLQEGSYYLVAEKEGYNTVTRTITVASEPKRQVMESFQMYLNAECQSDCTKNDRTCYAECEGVNDCIYATYNDLSIASSCDGLREGSRVVLTEATDTISNSIYGNEVYCCTGEPQDYAREYFSAEDVDTNCVENIISRSKGFWVNGEWVDVHFVIFSDPHPEKEGCDIYESFMCETYGGAFCS